MTRRRPYGSGSLYVRADRAGSETWYGHWRANGRQVKRKIGTKRTEGTRQGLTRTQAEAELRRLMREIEVAAPVDERLSMAEVGRLYIADLERRGRKPETVRAAEVAVRVHFAPFFGERAIESIRQADIERLAAQMQTSGARNRRSGLAPKSVRNYLGTLSALFTFAQRRGYVRDNPVSLVELPTVEANPDIRFLTPQEVRAVVDAVGEGPYELIDRTLFLTAAMTGLRLGELRALRWRDVDWSAGRVRVRRNYVRGRYGTPKTRRAERSVPLAKEVAAALRVLHQRSGSHGPNDLVFDDPVAGGPLNDNDIRDRLRVALRASQLEPSHTFHDLRHTFGTAMAAAGVPMRTLQEWMGHRDLTTTQRYADYAPSAEHEMTLIRTAFHACREPGRSDVAGAST